MKILFLQITAATQEYLDGGAYLYHVSFVSFLNLGALHNEATINI